MKPLLLCCVFSLQLFVHDGLAMEGAAVPVQTSSSSWKQSLKATAKDFWSYLKDTGAIMWSCIRHPTQVAAFSASSPWVVGTILSHVKPGNVLEIGTGAGTISVPLLEHRCGAWYDGVELRPELHAKARAKVDALQMIEGRLSTWRHIQTYCANFVAWMPEGSGEANLAGFYDTIISTVPITRLPREVMEAILTKVNRLLKPGGIFIYVSLAGARSLGHWIGFFKALFCHPEDWREYKRKLKFIDTWIKENFDQEEVIVWRNFTPMRVYWAVKKN